MQLQSEIQPINPPTRQANYTINSLPLSDWLFKFNLHSKFQIQSKEMKCNSNKNYMQSQNIYIYQINTSLLWGVFLEPKSDPPDEKSSQSSSSSPFGTSRTLSAFRWIFTSSPFVNTWKLHTFKIQMPQDCTNRHHCTTFYRDQIIPANASRRAPRPSSQLLGGQPKQT